MRKLRLTAVSLWFVVMASLSASAQTATTSKIGLIDTTAFSDPKTGITKYVAAVNNLNAEFKPLATELDTLGVKIQNLEKEIKTLQEQQTQGRVPVNQTTVNAKLEEYDKLTREYKFKKEDAEARYGRRQETLLGPIRVDIGNALQDFAKKNGYTVLLDIAKLTEAGLILAIDEKADVTKDFITFYNARPATTATVSK